MNKIIYISLAIILSLNAIASEHYSSIFSQGNEFYAANNYEKAIESYQSVISAGYESTQLYFNTGNAFYKLNELPSAILYYEKALKLDPSNKDASYNLNVVNQQITDKIEVLPNLFIEAWWNSLQQSMTSSGWAWLIIILSITLCLLTGLFYTGKLVSTKRISFYGMVITFFLLLIGGIAGRQNFISTKGTSAIVFTPSLTVKSSPANNGTDLFVIHEGTKVTIIEIQSGWQRVSIADGNSGWIKTTDTQPI